MVRLMCEQPYHDSSSFLTLTLRDENLKWGYQVPTLDPRDLTLFMKRLRKAFPKKRIRFYGCGEYGEKTGRPHYHVILFGMDFKSDRILSRKSKSGLPLWTSPTLDSIWGLGDALIGDASSDSMEYTAGYCMKKLKGLNSGVYDCLGIHPEFARMSRKPGIGTDFYIEHGNRILPHLDALPINDFVTSIPSFFNRKFKLLEPYRYELTKTLRQLKYENSQRSDPDRAYAREITTRAKNFTVLMRDFE